MNNESSSHWENYKFYVLFHRNYDILNKEYKNYLVSIDMVSKILYYFPG